MSTTAPSEPPARRIRLLADLAPGAAVVFGLLTVWMVVSTAQQLGQAMTVPSVASRPVLTSVLSLGLGVAAALVAGLITYRLAVEVPRTLRGWEAALAERTRVLRADR